METNNKLREVLECLRDASREFCHLILNSKYNEVFDKYKYAEVAKIRDAIANANAALAAPLRNCDVYTADELKDIFNRELAPELPIANEHEKNLITITAMGVIDTLFAIAKEGETNGSN